LVPTQKHTQLNNSQKLAKSAKTKQLEPLRTLRPSVQQPISNHHMHKPTQQPETCRLESPSTQSMRFSREKHTLDRSRVRFQRFNRKVPATYFPLFEIDREKTPRKTASRVRRVESTFHSKKSNEWKVQTAQNPNRNSQMTISLSEASPTLRLRTRLNHKDHHEHKERGANLFVFFVSFVNFVVKTKWRWVSRVKPALSLLWFNQNEIRIVVSSWTRSSRADRVQEIARHSLASSCTACRKLSRTACYELCRMESRRSVASFCSKLRQRVTLRAQQPAGHSCFLLLVAIFGQKNCAPCVRTSHKSITSTCGSLFSQTRFVPRNPSTRIGRTLVICECKNHFPIETNILR
jgi:hypothetical protein